MGEVIPVIRVKPLATGYPVSRVLEWLQFRQVEIFRRGEFVKLRYHAGDFGDCRVLTAIVGDGVPEGDGVAVDNDRLVNVDGPHSRIIGRLKPPGDGDCPPRGLRVGVRARYPCDNRGGKPVDRIRAEPQQSRV